MKFSEQWLRTMCDPPLTSDALREGLTMAGLEVEAAEPAAPAFTGVVVGRITAVEPHPRADRLRICTVDVGTGAALTIVCGAPNAAVGLTVPCALENAVLPGGVVIRRATVRGVESCGMLCSSKELGIDDDASGLLVLAATHAPGTPLRTALALDDTLITLKITPNRADCLSIAGIAQEVGAITGAPLTLPEVVAAPVTFDGVRPVRVDAPDGCPRFVGRLIDGIDPAAPTPEWMVRRLARSGIRSIAAVVDVTNYVMLELGQPLHAYDDRQLEGGIVVRFARDGETLTLLNGQVLELDTDLLLVCDEKKPLGLAGIMGGEHSGIGKDTKRIYLEGAFWTPTVIQGRMRRLGFTSDAGYRFERGVDFNGCARAVERATALIVEICGGRPGPLTNTADATTLPRREPIRVRTGRVARILGVAIPATTIARVLTQLGLPFTRDGDDFAVTPPSRRFDLAIEEDVIEEVARIHGYAAIPATPRPHVARMLPDPEATRSRHDLKQTLVALGWQEVITFSFVSSATEAVLGKADGTGDTTATPVVVQNPIAAHLDVLRTSLLPGLIETLCTNVNRKLPRARIFELGRIFRRDGTAFAQPLRLGGLAYGRPAPEQWGEAARPVDFYDVKGDLETLVAPATLVSEHELHPALHPGRAAVLRLDGASVGWLGELHPRLVRHFDLPHAPVVFELAVEALTAVRMPVGAPVARTPLVRRDLALVVDDALPAQALLDALRGASPTHVRTVSLFDVYRGRGLSDGRKSLAILVLMQDTSRTLTDADIDATEAQLVAVAREKFGAELRR